MSEKKFYEDGNFWTGVGSFYLLSFCVLFYPALVCSISVGNLFIKEGEDYSLIGIVSFLIFVFIIALLEALKQYKLLIWIYALTLWPFLECFFLREVGLDGVRSYNIDWIPNFSFDWLSDNYAWFLFPILCIVGYIRVMINTKN